MGTILYRKIIYLTKFTDTAFGRLARRPIVIKKPAGRLARRPKRLPKAVVVVLKPFLKYG